MRGFFTPGFSQQDIVSGMITSGDLSPNSVTSGDVASGQIGTVHLADGSILTIDIASGQVQSGQVGSGAVQNATIGSGQVQGHLGTGIPSILSGTVGPLSLGSGSVLSGHVASGQLNRYHLNSGTVVDLIACEQLISGLLAVAWGSGGCFVVPAERTSGLRSFVIGACAGTFASGDVVPVVRQGILSTSASGTIASGFFGRFLYLGSGGLIINQSGFMDGASSGHGAQPTAAGSGYSGAMVVPMGISVSGGIDVRIGELRSGLFSGGGGQY